MKALTFKQYQDFLKEKIKVKVTNKENVFYDYVCPVNAIGINWVDCDVDNDGGTTTFDFTDVELTDEPIKYDFY